MPRGRQEGRGEIKRNFETVASLQSLTPALQIAYAFLREGSGSVRAVFQAGSRPSAARREPEPSQVFYRAML